MRSVEDMLRDADPVRREPPRRAEDRDAIRRVIVEAAARSTPPAARLTTVRTSIALVALVLVFIAVGSRFWPRGATDVIAAVRFEVRLAETQFSPGLRPARIAASERVVYLHPEVVVTNADILQTSVIQNRTSAGFGVAVSFTANGADKMRRATASHIGAPVAILIDGDVVTAPTLRSAITDSAVISGDFTKAEAERIANGMSIR